MSDHCVDSQETFLPEKLAICVTFHFSQNRLAYLTEAGARFHKLARQVSLHVVTNTDRSEDIAAIRACFPAIHAEIVVPDHLGHPFLLTWIHRRVLGDIHASDPNVSHFLYLEDDLRITEANILYWLRWEPVLSRFGLYPSFFRFEQNRRGHRVCTDATRSENISLLPHVRVSEHAAFVNAPNPYQGLYLFDRTRFGEFISSDAASPDFGTWKIREKATQGLTFFNVPTGCRSRNFVLWDNRHGIDGGALIHHLPNNYAENPATRFGTVRVEDVFYERKLGVRDFLSRRTVKKILRSRDLMKERV